MAIVRAMLSNPGRGRSDLVWRRVVVAVGLGLALPPTHGQTTATGSLPASADAAVRMSPRADATPSTMTTTVNRSGAYSVQHEPSWTAKVEGPAMLLTPTAVPDDPEDPEFYLFRAAPWAVGGSLDNPEYADEAVTQLLADVPMMRPDGPVERLGEGVALVRCSTFAEGRRVRMIALGKVMDAQIVSLISVGTDSTLRDRELRARRLFASLARVAPAEFGAASLGPEDAVFVGVWSADEVMSAGGGFDFGGGASMVTQRILELNPDGSFRYGSRAAGGGPGVTFDAAFSVQQAGTWSVERGAGGTYLVFVAGGGAERVRSVLYEGKLVLGESGGRKFYSRLR